MDKAYSKSNFASFLQSYKAKNYASIKPFLSINLDEIRYNIELLIAAIENQSNNKTLVESLKRTQKILDSDSDLIEIAMKFGNSIDTNFMLFDLLVNDESEISIIFKRIIYNFVEFAKKSEENKLIDLAISIANKFIA